MVIEPFYSPRQVGDFTIYNVTPVPGGDCLLFVGEDITFVYDTGFGFPSQQLADSIQTVLGQRGLDYILLTHSHYDHAFGSGVLRERFPGSRVIAHSYAAYVFSRPGARKTMLRMDTIEADRQGSTAQECYLDLLRVDLPVEDGDERMLGSHRMQIVGLPGHTKDCIGFWFPEDGILLGCESTGVIVSDTVVMPAPLVGFGLCLQALEKLSGLNPKYFFLSHRGMMDSESFREYLTISRRCHLQAKELILQAAREGLDVPQTVERYAEAFYMEDCRDVYPPAAFLENTGILIPLILREFAEES